MVMASVGIAAASLLLSVVTIILLCRVLSAYRRLARTGREMPLSPASATELVSMQRRGSSNNDEFLDCEDDEDISAQTRRISQHLTSFHGVSCNEGNFNGNWE